MTATFLTLCSQWGTGDAEIKEIKNIHILNFALTDRVEHFATHQILLDGDGPASASGHLQLPVRPGGLSLPSQKD